MRWAHSLLMLSALVWACHGDEHDHGAHGHEPGEHAQGDPAGHGHGHDEDAVAMTHFTDVTELFVEVPPLVVGEEAVLAAHVTLLRDGAAATGGTMTVVLGGDGLPEERFEVAGVSDPGIFRPKVVPELVGTRRLVIQVSTAGEHAQHDLGMVEVYGSDAEAHGAAGAHPHPEPAAAISFLKEQQWKMAFQTAAVERHRIRPSFEAYGTLRARPSGEAEIVTPVRGRVAALSPELRIGALVAKDATVGHVTPALAEQGDDGALVQAIDEARIAVRQAKVERTRLEGLLEDGAVAERRVIEAGFAQELAQAHLKTARRRHKQVKRARDGSGGGDGDVALRSPISGTVVSVDTVTGAWVEEGARLARVVDLETLWLEIHVAEAHAGMLETPGGAWFEVEGFDETIEIGADGVVTAGGVLDERTRTLPLLIEVPNPKRRLRVGMFANVHVLTDAPRMALAVPVAAILYEAGLPVVYVQLGGETFTRRPVRLGARDGDFIEVIDGLRHGERVVSVGTYAVRLASSVTAVPAHGHSH